MRTGLCRCTALLVLPALLSCTGRGRRPEVVASGTIEATEVRVAAKVGGELLSLRVDEGDPVRQGDTLAVIDHATLRLQLKQAEAGVDLADAQMQLLLNGARTEDIRQTEEGLKQARAGLQNAEEDLRRVNGLFQTRAATPKQKDDAEARRTVALAQVAAAEQVVKKTRQWTRPEDLRAAQARLNQAMASVDLLNKTVSDCFVTAPGNGVVTHRPVEPGELVGQGSTLLTVSKLDRVHLMVYVTEVELGRVKLGQPAEVRTDTDPHRAFQGRVVYISPAAEFTPKNVQTKEDRVKLVFGVKIELENRDGALKPGMPADATIKTSN